MNPRELDALLLDTLRDYRLSGGEKAALKQALEGCRCDAQALGALRHRAFELARGEVLTPQAAQVLGWLEEVVKVLAPRPAPASAAVADACFGPGPACLNRLLALIRQARSTLDVCVFTITDDRITSALLAAHRRGVRVRIISDDQKAGDLGADIATFRQAGVPLRMDRAAAAHMHHKFALFDAELLLTGSFNWTRGASEVNQENLLVTSEPRLVHAFGRTFEQLWDQFGP
jgi:phosphatidylserine/phosphatidylglycerophosphate/cardiolipin synthase-like enzyme